MSGVFRGFLVQTILKLAVGNVSYVKKYLNIWNEKTNHGQYYRFFEDARKHLEKLA